MTLEDLLEEVYEAGRDRESWVAWKYHNRDKIAALERSTVQVMDDMPKDREELQKLLNEAYRLGNQNAHNAHKFMAPVVGGVPELRREELLRLIVNQTGSDDVDYGESLENINAWIKSKWGAQ